MGGLRHSARALTACSESARRTSCAAASEAAAAGLGDQPVVKSDGGSEVGRGIEVGEQTTGFAQVPTDDGRGVADCSRVDHSVRAVRQQMEERRQARNVLRGFGCHFADVGEISAGSQRSLEAVMCLHPGGVCRGRQ